MLNQNEKARRKVLEFSKEIVKGFSATIVGSVVIFGAFVLLNKFSRNETLFDVGLLFTFGFIICGASFSLYNAFQKLKDDDNFPPHNKQVLVKNRISNTKVNQKKKLDYPTY
ncbi:hypothetical protein ACKXGF_07370 [Alkalibacillus sp. S2W]|uniref:hypothetical protein n=1 Tax=Alkalibacillus sp. S2W TaxID=3386553 RepID=UPI00398D4BED